MNLSESQPFHFLTETGNEVWLFHYLWHGNAPKSLYGILAIEVMTIVSKD